MTKAVPSGRILTGTTRGLPSGQMLNGTRQLPTGSIVTPATVAGSNLINWWTIGLSETVVGGFVTQVTDLSAAGYNLTAAASQQALYESRSWNGQPSMAFDGLNDFYQYVAAFATDLAGGNDHPFMWWFAFQQFILTDSVIASLGAGANTPLLDYFTSTTSGKFRATKNDGTAKNVDSAIAADLNRHWAKLVNTGTSLQMTIDGAIVAPFVANNFDTGSVTFNRATLGALGRTTFSTFMKGRLAASVAVKAILDAASEAVIDSYMDQWRQTPTRPMCIANGDSYSLSTEWQPFFEAAYPKATIVNTAVGGQTAFGYGLPNLSRDTTSIPDDSRPGTLISVQFMSNDVVNGRTATQIHDNLTTICTTAKAMHPSAYVVVNTMHKRLGLSAGEEIVRTNANSLVRSDKCGADNIIDRDGIIPEPATDTAIFRDGTHLTALGNSYIANGRFAYPGMIQLAALAGGFT